MNTIKGLIIFLSFFSSLIWTTSCNKNTDLAGFELKNSLSKIELAQKVYETQVAMGATSMLMHLDQPIENKELRVYNKSIIGCIPKDIASFLEESKYQKDISFATFNLLDDYTLEVNILLTDKESEKRLESDSYKKALFIADNLIIPHNVRETFKLREGAYFPKGDYIFEQTDELPLGIIRIKIDYQ